MLTLTETLTARPDPRLRPGPAKRMQIKRIARRWLTLLHVQRKAHPPLEQIERDLCDIVASGIVFSLDALERFDDGDFAHDMEGIATHMDPGEHRLRTSLFLPRCSRKGYIDAILKEE